MIRSRIAPIVPFLLLWPLFAPGGEPAWPRIELARQRDHIQATGEVLVYGTVTPAPKSEVEVRLYYVGPDGGEFLQAGASTPMLEGGKFRTTIVPGAGGWRPGTMRIEASLRRLRQVKASQSETVDPPDFPLVAAPAPPVRSSGRVLDMTAEPAAAPSVPPGQWFRLKGTFRATPEERDGIGGPSVLGRIESTLPDGRLMIWTEDYVVSLADPQEPGTFHYEVELLAPEPGQYRLKVAPLKAANAALPLERRFEVDRPLIVRRGELE